MDNEYYITLGLERNSTPADIKKAYRNLAKKHHPDKGGNADTFRKISAAYEVLSDPEKRAKYDAYGKGGPPTGGIGDVFSMFFGQGGATCRPGGRKKGKNVVHHLEVSLEDMCNGRTVKVSVTRNRLKYSDGTVAPINAFQTCAACKGQGVQVQIRRIGPMIQQVQTSCPVCKGSGTSCIPGIHAVKERKILEVTVAIGAKEGDRLTFSGESDQHPGVEPGDIVFVLRQKPHPTFVRKVNDLYTKQAIDLSDALCGAVFPLTLLNGRTIQVSTEGAIVHPGKTVRLSNKGMPSTGTTGHLYITFSVTFPQTLSPQHKKVLKTILPSCKKKPNGGSSDSVVVTVEEC
jgi:DnaJ homolog subfamily A member 2